MSNKSNNFSSFILFSKDVNIFIISIFNLLGIGKSIKSSLVLFESWSYWL